MATFFDETNEQGLGEKRKATSRRSSFRKTLALITESKPSSLELSSGGIPTPSSPRQRRSFSLHRRNSSSIASVAEPPQSPSHYYHDPEARLKLRMVAASPERFDQVLEHGFPALSKSEPTEQSLEKTTEVQKAHRHTITATTSTRASPAATPAKKIARHVVAGSSFLDNSSSEESESEDDDQLHSRSSVAKRRAGERPRQDRSGSGSARSGLSTGSDGEDDTSISDHGSPLTPQWKDGPNLASPFAAKPDEQAEQSHYKHHQRLQSDVSFPEIPPWDVEEWNAGPREMTLRMTLTRPELRDTAGQLSSTTGERPYRTGYTYQKPDNRSPKTDSESSKRAVAPDLPALEALPPVPNSKPRPTKGSKKEHREGPVKDKKTQTLPSKLQAGTTGKVRGLFRRSKS